MLGQVRVDASDFARHAEAMRRLPQEFRIKAFSRAMRRMTTMTRTRVVRRIAERVSIPQKFVRDVTRAKYGEADTSIEVTVRSGWMPLYKFGASQNASGVKVKARGSYRHAFIARMSSGHTGVFRRAGKSRLPIHELFGPNPANDVATSPEEYEQVIVDLLGEALVPRLAHELGRLLPK